MKHYLVILDWATHNDAGEETLGIKHTFEEAKEIFNQRLPEEIQFAEDNGYIIGTNDETEFEAYEDGYYAAEHTLLYIKEVE